MKKTICWILIILYSIMFISACGPSEEAIATMTASVWTPTPEPTLTPIPLPYDLEVTLEDESGNPVTMAYVEVKELETDASAVDDTGNVAFLDLPGEEVTLVVSAQGYNPVEETITLERGMNTKSYSMQIDPLQIHPSEACQEGQKVLYIEDFEDQILQDWEGYARPMWDLVEVERGTILSGIEESYMAYRVQEFGNMVWHMDIRRPADACGILTHFSNESFTYMAGYLGNNHVTIQREAIGEIVDLADRPQRAADGETWEKISLVYFEGEIEIWKNDELLLAAHDEDLFEKGTIAIEFFPTGDKVLFDNIVICELTEPYAPPVSEENVD